MIYSARPRPTNPTLREIVRDWLAEHSEFCDFSIVDTTYNNGSIWLGNIEIPIGWVRNSDLEFIKVDPFYKTVIINASDPDFFLQLENILKSY